MDNTVDVEIQLQMKVFEYRIKEDIATLRKLMLKTWVEGELGGS